MKHTLWIAYFVALLLAMTWPVNLIANRTEPRVFGFPFIFCWYVGIVACQFLGLLVMYKSIPRDDHGDDDEL